MVPALAASGIVFRLETFVLVHACLFDSPKSDDFAGKVWEGRQRAVYKWGLAQRSNAEQGMHTECQICQLFIVAR